MKQSQPYTRREFLALGGVAAVGVVVAGCGTQDDGTTPATSAPGPNLDPLEIRLTESPADLLNDREVLGSKRVIFEALDTPTSFDLTGARPDHHYAFTVERTANQTSIDLDVVLAGELWKEVHATYTTDEPLNRLWVSRGYLHGEGHTTSCFPAPEDVKPFEGQVWFGSFDEDRRLLDETLGSFDYSAPRGTVEVPLHNGFTYTREWQTHSDGVGHDYTTTWLHGDQSVNQIRESVIGLAVMEDERCSALASGSYCDTDQI